MTNTLNDRMGGFLLSHRSISAGERAHAAPAVTISREAGAGGSSIARCLATYLEKHQPGHRGSWAVFDQNLVRKALEQHSLPGHLEQYLPEDAAHLLPDTVEDLLGLHPAASELARQLSETMVNLARQGNVILVGRGGNISTARLPNVLHVRLVAPYPERLKHVSRLYNFPEHDAAEFIAKTDRARKRYLRQNFGADVGDPVLYDLTVNTARLTCDEAAALIGDVILRRMSEDGAPDDPHEEAVRAWSSLQTG